MHREARARAQQLLKEKPADLARYAAIEMALRRAEVRLTVARRQRTRTE